MPRWEPPGSPASLGRLEMSFSEDSKQALRPLLSDSVVAVAHLPAPEATFRARPR